MTTRHEDPVAALQRRVASAVRSVVVGKQPPIPETAMADADDPGLFGPDSVAWRVHRDVSMFVGGLRALFLQTMHPLAMAGVAEHSDYRRDPWGRLQRTSSFIGTTTYGSTEVATAAIRRVVAVHRRVRGTAPDGRPYSADDPHLLAWVHVTEADSFLRAHQRYGANPLSASEADRYVAEMAQIAERLGSEPVPTSVVGLADWLQSVRPELAAGTQARDAARFLLFPPMPLISRGPYGVIVAAAVGLLPRRVRWDLWIPSPPFSDPLLVQPAARLLLGGLGWALQAAPDGPVAATEQNVEDL